MKIMKAFIIITFLVFAGISIYYFIDTDQVYGNDRQSIEKVIKLIKGNENKAIEIVEIKDFNDQRIVGFLSNNSPGYIQFQKSEDGNYLWKHIQVEENQTFSIFSPDLPMFMIVTNNENKIAKMQVSVNGKILEQDFTPHETTVTWIDFPKSLNNAYTFRDYKFYDGDGTIIKEYE